MIKKIIWAFAILIIILATYVAYTLMTTRNHSPSAVAEYKETDFLIEVN
jgi:CHASE3 domain sensor protein